MRCKLEYFQLPLFMFLALYPQYRIPPYCDIDSTDKNYIVRFVVLPSGDLFAEIGYLDDEWHIFK